MTSTSSSDLEAEFLDEQVKAGLERELEEAGKLMGELPIEEGNVEKKEQPGTSKSMAAPSKKRQRKPVIKKEKMAADPAKKSVKRKAGPTSDAPPFKKPAKKPATKSNKHAEEGQKGKKKAADTDSSGTESDSEDTDSDETSGESDNSAGKVVVKDKFAWAKEPMQLQTFGQCKKCQSAQRALKEPVKQEENGLYALIAQCQHCLNNNSKLRMLYTNNFGEKLGKTPAKGFEFVAEDDDYKCCASVYACTLGQCGYCRRRQAKMRPEEMLSKGKKGEFLRIAQCTACVNSNKQFQTSFWKAFSSWKQPGGGSSKRRHDTSESSEESSEDEKLRKRRHKKAKEAGESGDKKKPKKRHHQKK